MNATNAIVARDADTRRPTRQHAESHINITLTVGTYGSWLPPKPTAGGGDMLDRKRTGGAAEPLTAAQVLRPTGTEGDVLAIPVARAKMLYDKWQGYRTMIGQAERQVNEKGAPMPQPVTMRIFSDYV